jgi:hypothetical protein
MDEQTSSIQLIETIANRATKFTFKTGWYVIVTTEWDDDRYYEECTLYNPAGEMHPLPSGPAWTLKMLEKLAG